MARLSNPFRGVFSFLFARSQKEELVAEYIIREHHRGRSFDDILDDPYVKNRLSTDQVRGVLERPELLAAVGEDMVAAHLSKL